MIHRLPEERRSPPKKQQITTRGLSGPETPPGSSLVYVSSEERHWLGTIQRGSYFSWGLLGPLCMGGKTYHGAVDVSRVCDKAVDCRVGGNHLRVFLRCKSLKIFLLKCIRQSLLDKPNKLNKDGTDQKDVS